MNNNTTDKLNKLHALQQSFARQLPERLVSIESGWKKIQQQGIETREFTELKRVLHTLAGSAGTFHYCRMGEQMRALESLIDQYATDPLSTELVDKTELLLKQVHECIKQGPDESFTDIQIAPVKGVSRNKESVPLVYILEDDEHLIQSLESQLKHFGYKIEHFSTPLELKAAINKQKPDVLLSDIDLPHGRNGGTDAATDIHKNIAPQLPIIFMSGHDTWQDRVNAVRAGGIAYLLKPINQFELAEQLDLVTGKEEETVYRILIVDDMPLLLEHYSMVLQNAGMTTLATNETNNLLNLISEFSPDLILMDLYMPDCTGVEAAQVIRQQRKYINLPIVYLSSEKDLQQQLQALRMGGDDFLKKPINDAHLVEAVKIRAERFRKLKAIMSRDSLTGLLNHINLKLALEREISQATRRKSCLSFAMIDIDHFKSINDRYGHPVGDRVLKSLARLFSNRLRKGDLIARYGGEEFGIILPDTRHEDAKVILDQLRDSFSKVAFTQDNSTFNVTFSAGVAYFPEHTDMQTLIAAADKLLYEAKTMGRNRVMIHQPNIKQVNRF